MARAPSYTDHYWFSHDDVRLHCRRYTGPTNRPPILCIPGLTRNVRDWEPVAKRLGGKWPLITISLRGRGESGYARDPMTYVPLSYIRDIERLLEDLRIDQFILFGTSLGGLITMMMAAAHPGRVKGALINDIGPDIEQEGLDRIKNYVGRTTQWPTWLHAARAVADANAGIYPDYDMIDWLDMAKRVCRLTREGRIVYDYDPQISVPFKLPPEEAPVDGWVVLNTLRDVPTLIVRGGLSDLFSAKTAQKMVKKLRRAHLVTVPDVGHAPLLDESEAVAGIDALLAEITAAQAPADKATV